MICLVVSLSLTPSSSNTYPRYSEIIIIKFKPSLSIENRLLKQVCRNIRATSLSCSILQEFFNGIFNTPSPQVYFKDRLSLTVELYCKRSYCILYKR